MIKQLIEESEKIEELEDLFNKTNDGMLFELLRLSLDELYARGYVLDFKDLTNREEEEDE